MVNCAAYGCRSGYKSQKSTTLEANVGHESTDNTKLSYHGFPIQDKDLCDKWVRAIRREEFVATKYSKLCSLHFKETDFVAQSRDSNKRRRKSNNKQLCRRYLKDDAVPSILPNAPQYLTNTSGVPRTTVRATMSSRLDYQAVILGQMEESFLAEDDISRLSTEEIADRLEKETSLPQGFTVKCIEQTLFIYIIEVTDDVPKIKGSITVKADLSVVVVIEEKIINASHYKDLVCGPLTKMSQIVNLMARVKSLSSETSTRSLELLVHMAIECLKAALSNMDDTQSPKHRKLSFIVEQLQLLVKHKFSRRYSPQLIIMCFIVYAASKAAYSVLREENILEIPSISTLRKVTRRVNVNEGLDNSSYLKLRVSKLNAFERVVILMIDEIYIAKRVEYSGGEVKGLTPDGAVASTLLCFMVKSLVSKFKDLVGIYPMANLTAAKQFTCYNEVMVLLRSVGLNVIAISVDNAATNRKFYVDCLCNGQLQTSIIDSVTGQPIFLIFDPVHDLKNVYNNLQSRKTFQCPSMGYNLPPEGCTAQFQDIVDLFNMEAVMSLKKAHRLSPAVLQPKNIEKLSVKLATAVFNESTRDALEFYAITENKPHWMSTAAFIKLIIKLWNVMNVKSRSKGKHKRDSTMDPVRSSSDWKLLFLREFADFLWRWETSKSQGLTHQTFLALRHTCLALADCAAYLLDRLSFNYVLLGNLQSDVIESRFGWLRQLSGANYYISMRQVLESDCKIRALSLLKFSSFSLSEIDDNIHTDAHDSLLVENSSADKIVEELTFKYSPSSSDTNIIFYVSGYIARSVFRSNHCEHCKESLINSDPLEPLTLSETLDSSATIFLDSINRGGLSKPTDLAFMMAVLCWRVWEEVRSTPEMMRLFLASTSQRSLFCKLMDRASYTGNFIDQFHGETVCTGGHDMVTLIARRFFNCVAKNLAKEFTNKANEKPGQSGNSSVKKRKLAKLSGSSSDK